MSSRGGVGAGRQAHCGIQHGDEGGPVTQGHPAGTAVVRHRLSATGLLSCLD